MVEVDLFLATPESRFHSSTETGDVLGDGEEEEEEEEEEAEFEPRRAGCSSAGGATMPGGTITIGRWRELWDEADEDEGRLERREGSRETIIMGGSAGAVFSYRKATMLGSSRRLVRRSAGCFCRTLPNLEGNMMLMFVWAQQRNQWWQ
jgi:hypothetical protein